MRLLGHTPDTYHPQIAHLESLRLRKPLAMAKPIVSGITTIAMTRPAVRSLTMFLVRVPLAKSSKRPSLGLRKYLSVRINPCALLRC